MPASSQLPTAMEIIAHLDRFVIGQERAKKDLATAVYQHYVGSRYGELPDAQFRDLERQHVLLLGPTGSGKTYLVKVLADLLQVPMVTGTATSFSEVGYVGQRVESLVAGLLQKTNWDVFRAQRGIVFLDEVDKLKRARMAERDVSGEGVQSALLTLLDGHLIDISAGENSPNARRARIDVSKILFICAGAFVGLEQIIAERVREKQGIGFARGGRGARGTPVAGLAQLTTPDLEAFGLIPELIGRFSAITHLDALDKGALLQILSQAEGNVIAKQQAHFALHGIELKYDKKALEALVERAMDLQTGARALRRMVAQVVDPVDYRLPELAAEGVKRITITAATVREGAEPHMVRGKGANRTPVLDTIRRTAMLPAPAEPSSIGVAAGSGISDTAGWTEEQIQARLGEVMKVVAGEVAGASARKWWEAFVQENRHRPALVLRLAEELMGHRATLDEFFQAYVYSNTDNIQANLYYMLYARLKREAEKTRKGRKDDPPAA